MSAKRNNYKAKWLAALQNGQQYPTEYAEKNEAEVDVISGTQYNVTQNLTALHNTLIETGSAALSLGELMDDTRDVEAIKFSEIGHVIDTRISQMPSKIIARRARDIMRLAEERIGVLHAMCVNQQEAIGKLASQMYNLSIENRNLQNTAVSTLLVGKNPTEDEIETYVANPRAKLRDSEYSELPDDWTALMNNSSTYKTDNTHVINDSPHDSGADSDNSDISNKEQTGVSTEIVKPRKKRRPRVKSNAITFN